MCPGCVPRQGLRRASRFASTAACTEQCQPPTCMDMVKNGNGDRRRLRRSRLRQVLDDKGCTPARTARAGVRQSAECPTPACNDGVKNRTETDIDCGGKKCPACGAAKCAARMAIAGTTRDVMSTCGATGVVSVGVGRGLPSTPTATARSLVAPTQRQHHRRPPERACSTSRATCTWSTPAGHLSKIDPDTLKEIARYCTAPGCNSNPSRVSVRLAATWASPTAPTTSTTACNHPERASAVMIAGDIALRRPQRQRRHRHLRGRGRSRPVPWPANSQISPDECVLWYTLAHQGPQRQRRRGRRHAAALAARSSSKPSRRPRAASRNFYVGLYGTRRDVQIDAANGRIIKQQVAAADSPTRRCSTPRRTLASATPKRAQRPDPRRHQLADAVTNSRPGLCPAGTRISADRAATSTRPAAPA